MDRYISLIYLHSTMLLLYQVIHTFHNKHNILIYIPLCFYFIFNALVNGASGLVFTFHYASTLSLTIFRHREQTLHLHSTMLLLYQRRTVSDHIWPLFTFHYASTLSNSCLGGMIFLMLIYIPLCFYFICAGNLRFFCSNIDLHSTMLLLYLTL